VVGIVDYNMGNLASVINAFAKVGADAVLESDPSKSPNREGCPAAY